MSEPVGGRRRSKSVSDARKVEVEQDGREDLVLDLDLDEVGPSKPDDLLYEAVRQRRIVRQSRSRGRRVAKRWVTECGGRGSGRELDVEWVQATKQVDMPRVVEKGKFAKSRRLRGGDTCSFCTFWSQRGRDNFVPFGHNQGVNGDHGVVGTSWVSGATSDRGDF